MREIKVNELKEGMTTAVDVFSPKGQLILKRHQAVSAFDIAKFGFYNIASVYIEGSSAQEKEEWKIEEVVITTIITIGIIVIAAIFVYNLSVKTGGMDTIKTTLTAISADRRIQVLIIAWGFGGFLEGASGFGTSVAIPAAILVGLGFNPIQSCIICLLSNVPVAELGAIGIPVITGASLTNLNATTVSGFAVLQLFVLIVVCPIFMVRLAGKLKGVWATTLVSGLAFAVPAYLIGAFVGPELSTLVGAIGSLVATFAMAKTVNKTGQGILHGRRRRRP